MSYYEKPQMLAEKSKEATLNAATKDNRLKTIMKTTREELHTCIDDYNRDVKKIVKELIHSIFTRGR